MHVYIKCYKCLKYKKKAQKYVKNYNSIRNKSYVSNVVVLTKKHSLHGQAVHCSFCDLNTINKDVD